MAFYRFPSIIEASVKDLDFPFSLGLKLTLAAGRRPGFLSPIYLLIRLGFTNRSLSRQARLCASPSWLYAKKHFQHQQQDNTGQTENARGQHGINIDTDRDAKRAEAQID